MQLHHKTYGDGETIVILHGLFGSLDNWHSISLKLAQRFRVVAVDQRNHGRSPHSQEMDYGLMAEDLDELLNELRIERAHILGHSMGGKTAMRFALTFPVRVRSLIVVDIAPRVYPPFHDEILDALLSLEPQHFENRKQMEDALAPSLPSLALRQFLLKNAERASDGHFRWRFGLKELSQNYGKLQAEMPQDRHFDGPVLFIRGADSDYLSESDLPGIRRLFPRAALEIIANAGHLVHAENPQAFLKMVETFLTNFSVEDR
jgi:pimeloyl-ACP methyl ester carboxylesterase